MNEISTAGVTVAYAVSADKPATGYTKISNIKGISSLNPQPSTLDCTDLGETEFKRAIPGLKDIGGVITFSANCTNDFQTAWATLVSAYDAGVAENKSCWFQIQIPGLEKAFFFAGIPSPLGLSEIAVDEVLSIDAYVTPNKVLGWATKVALS